MSEPRADLLSPSFIGGLAGMAITGSSGGFLIGAALVWLILATLLTVAAIVTHQRERSIDELAVLLERRMARRGTAASQ